MNSFVLVVLALIVAAQANVVYRKLKVEDRIVGREIAVPNSFPYQALLVMNDQSGNTFQCSGSLLTTTNILTAAHCVIKVSVGIIVILGAHDANKFEATQQIKDGIYYAYHGYYNEQTNANDIAIVTMDSPVVLNQYVQLITLPTWADVGKTYAGQLATVSGWGIYSNAIGRASDILRFVSSPVVTNAECNEDYGYISPSQICINGKLLKLSCQDEYGGPLVTGANRTQIGIMSFGRREGCANGFNPVFTRITEYLLWIADNGDVQIN